MSQPSDKRTASQRIEDLEKAVMSIFQVTNNVTRDLSLIKDALKLLGNKADSICKLSVAGSPLTDENISLQMKQNQIDELKTKVQNFVDKGALVPADTVKDHSFVIGSENEPTAADGTPGKVVNSRIQFSLETLDKAIQDKLKGAKVGDIIVFEGDALVFQVNEIYDIVQPPAPEAPAPAPEASAPADAAPAPADPAPTADASAPAPEAPAAEQSSSDAAQAAAPAETPNPPAGN